MRAGTQPGLLAFGGSLELALEAIGDLAELDVGEAVVVDRGQAAGRRAGGEQDQQETGNETGPHHRTGL